jgi:hypothetical protein
MLDAKIGNNSISNNSKGENEEHDDTTEFEAVGHNGDDDCEDGGDGVGDHGPELCFVGGVAELDDDGWEEETEGV